LGGWNQGNVKEQKKDKEAQRGQVGVYPKSWDLKKSGPCAEKTMLLRKVKRESNQVNRR